MKYLLVLCCVLAAAVGEYTTKFDNINLDEILGNDRLFDAHFNCVMGRGKCTPEGNELKAHLPDALQNGCKDCTEAQKKGATKVIQFLIENKPALWKELVAKFDPEGKYRKKYEDEARANGITIPK